MFHAGANVMHMDVHCYYMCMGSTGAMQYNSRRPCVTPIEYVVQLVVYSICTKPCAMVEWWHSISKNIGRSNSLLQWSVQCN